MIATLPAETMTALERYSWPGNVRELEHLIERAVILTPGGELRVPLADLVPLPLPDGPAVEASRPPQVTLRGSERDLICRTLDECRWVIGGPHGAATRLGLKRTTLISRMKKLELVRPQAPGVE